MPMSAKEVALRLDTDARTLRKFLRAITPSDEQPGQGGRWLIEKTEIKGLKKQFADFRTAQATPKAKKAKAAPVEIDEDDDIEEVELDEEDEVEEPDDDDLEEIEDEEDEDIEEL